MVELVLDGTMRYIDLVLGNMQVQVERRPTGKVHYVINMHKVTFVDFMYMSRWSRRDRIKLKSSNVQVHVKSSCVLVFKIIRVGLRRV